MFLGKGSRLYCRRYNRISIEKAWFEKLRLFLCKQNCGYVYTSKTTGGYMKVDLTGQKFCRLTVLKRSENQNGSAVRRLCRCECGTETIATTNELRSGHKKSCGCLKHKPHPENLKGQRFGRLVVMKRIGTSEKDRHPIWRCKCDCGKKTEVRSCDLKSGNTKSCGCLEKAKAKNNN